MLQNKVAWLDEPAREPPSIMSSQAPLEKSIKGDSSSPNQKYQMFPLPHADIYLSILFWSELLSFGDIGTRDICPLANWQLEELKAAKKLNSAVSYQKS